MQTLQHWVLLWCLFQRTWKPKTYWGINYWETLLISNNISRNISLFDKDLIRCGFFAHHYLKWQYHWPLSQCHRIDTVVTYFVWIPQRLAGGGRRPPTVRSQHTCPAGRDGRGPKAPFLRVWKMAIPSPCRSLCLLLTLKAVHYLEEFKLHLSKSSLAYEF